MAESNDTTNELYIVVAMRVMPMSTTTSEWTWTLYKTGPKPLARAEYSWNSAETARKAAYAFAKTIGHKIPVKIAGR